MRLAALVSALLLAALPSSAADPAERCETSKLRAAAKLAACRLKADARAAKKGGPAEYEKCEKITARFLKAEERAGGACPSVGDVEDIRAELEASTLRTAIALSGAACLGNTACPEGEYCRRDTGFCGELGICVDQPPPTCPGVFDPVCGCDGMTYGNTCERAAAGVSERLPEACP